MDGRGDSDGVLVVGAGLAGLTAARALAAAGRRVLVVDKGRGPGGRTSRRRSAHPAGFEFDHGAQYFTVRDDRFATRVAGWAAAGVAAPWEGRIVALDDAGVRDVRPMRRWVGVPGMSAPARYEAAGLEVLQGVRVTGVDRREGRWRARVEGGALPDVRWRDLVVALPPAQAAELLGEPCPRLAAEAARVRMLPCRAVLVGFSGPLPLEFDGAFVDDDRLSWVARNSSKPGRSLAEAWVLHGSAGWSERRWDAPPAAAVRELLGALAERAGRALPDPAHVDVHGWRYALAEQPLETGCLWDASARAAVCGDWCAGSRVEGAFLSGLAAAAAVDEP